MSKIDAGRVQLEESPFDLTELVSEVLDMMSLRAQAKGLKISLEQSPDCPTVIVGDKARLRQILINLSGNALKFTQQGEVILRLKRKHDDPSRLILEVQDTGVGIAPECQQMVFDPFVQLGDQGDSKGTGLGLTITR